MSEDLSSLNRNLEKMTAEIGKMVSAFRTFSQHQYGPGGSSGSTKAEGTWYGKSQQERDEDKAAKFRKKYQEEEFRRLKNEKMFLDNQKIRMNLRQKEEKARQTEEKRKKDEDEKEFKRQQAIRELRLNKYRIQYDNIEKEIFRLRIERERKHLASFRRNQLKFEKLYDNSFLIKSASITSRFFTNAFFGSLGKVGLISSESSKNLSKITRAFGAQVTGLLGRGIGWMIGSDKRFFSKTRKELRKNRPRKIMTGDDGLESGQFTSAGSTSSSKTQQENEEKAIGKTLAYVRTPKQDSDGAIVVRLKKDLDYNRTDDYMRMNNMFSYAPEEKEKGFFSKLLETITPLLTGIGGFFSSKLKFLYGPIIDSFKSFAGKLSKFGASISAKMANIIAKVPFIGKLFSFFGKGLSIVSKVLSKALGPISGLISFATTEGGFGRRASAGLGSGLGAVGGAALGTFLGPAGTIAGGALGSFAGEYLGKKAYDMFSGEEGDAKGPNTISSLLSLQSQLDKNKGAFGFNLDASKFASGTIDNSYNPKQMDIISSLASKITGPTFIPRKYGTSGKGFYLNRNATLDGVYPDFKNSFMEMAQEYNQKTGKNIGVNSGFRTNAEQARLHAKDPSKAARPGMSPHEFGYAIDVNSINANELDSLGLLDKYGMRRPVRGEAWHLEPKITQSLKAKLRSGNISYSEGDGRKTEVIPRKDGGKVIQGKRYIVGEEGPEVLEVGGQGYVVPRSTPQELNTQQSKMVETSKTGEDFKQFLLQKFLPAMASVLSPGESQFVYKENSTEW